MISFIVLGIVIFITSLTQSSYFVDFDSSLTTYRYIMKGDLTIGAILPIHKRGVPCGHGLRESGAVQHVEALTFAIDKINSDPGLLQGLSLGLVVLDDCDTAETALGQALHFMPRCNSEQAFYDVVGVIGSESSDASLMIANVLSLFQVPQISPLATSDLLSNKQRYPYFLRMVPPDRLQVEAIISLIHHFNWTYIAVIYSTGGYGEEAYHRLQTFLDNSLCIGPSFAVSPDDPAYKYHTIVSELISSKVKVVVLLTDQEEARSVMEAAKGIPFVWIGSDGLGVNLDDIDGLEDVALGSLTLVPYSAPVPDFYEYFESLKPGNTANPWFNEMWKELFSCQGKPCALEKDILDAKDYAPETHVSGVIDSVFAFAYALDSLIQDHCPDILFEQCEEECSIKSRLKQCVNGPLLLQYLKNMSFTGVNGDIFFDANGDMLGKYTIQNFQKISPGKYINLPVGIWDAGSRSLTINDSLIVWGQVPSATEVPLSKCGSACKPGEVYSYFRGTCCWECRKCNANQITNGSNCQQCPLYSWPDENATTCSPLNPYHLRWHDPLSIVFTSLSVLGLSLCSLLLAMFIHHNHHRLIKATSRELSYLMLAGASLQYMLLISIVTPPSTTVCYLNYSGFNLSFTIVYAPLLTRTNRIYRIFKSGHRTKLLPPFTSPASQVVIAISIVAIQIIINIIVLVCTPPRVSLRMPISLEPHVELVCALPAQGLMTSLAYNLLIIVICTYYAFKTRTLPDNFNESRYICLCVYTTLVIWLAFLPTYFTNNRVFYQTILLGCALILNSTVILLCLFTPKVYAIYHNNSDNNTGFKPTMSNSTLAPRQNRPLQPIHVDDDITELSDFVPQNGIVINNIETSSVKSA